MTNFKIDFLFIGYPKSGSTTFYYLLKSHPEICMPNIKEINYFNTDHNLESKGYLKQNHFQLARSYDDYRDFFLGVEDKIKGDINPNYIFSTDAPKNIFEHNPATKILISIREPVSFLRSYHFQSLYNMVENEPDFLRALSLEESRRTGKNIPRYCYNLFQIYYSFLAEYIRHIKHFTNTFGFDNIKIVLFDDIAENENKVYRDILRFLKVKNLEFIHPKADQNPSHSLRFPWLRKIFFNPPIKKWFYKNTPKALLPMGVKFSQTIFKKEQDKPVVSEADINRVKIQFRSNVVELNSYLNETGLLNRDLLALWGYQ